MLINQVLVDSVLRTNYLTLLLTYFVPAFQDVTITDSFFTTYPSLNG
jgi:hypothetical protein